MNYKSLSLLIIVLFSACTLGAQNRKKVGIVLSGGGAKGVAHIGALKVIEEAGIPIDYVSGHQYGRHRRRPILHWLHPATTGQHCQCTGLEISAFRCP